MPRPVPDGAPTSVTGSARATALTTAGVRELAAALVTDDVVVLPVRHHSPACAWQVRRAIADRAPSVVLVEGPRSLTPLIPLLVHPEAQMPLAAYTYAHRDSGAGAAEERERWAAFFPLCDYSPELVALREAHALGVPARFIDLDHAEQRVLEAAAASDTDRHEAPDAPGRSLLQEHHYRHSRALRSLADRLGCRDHEDLWEFLVESDLASVSLDEHIARLVAYCLTARADATEAELTRDGTHAREAEMAWHVAAAVRERRPGDGPVLVVVGGFHAVVLPALLADPPERPSVDTTGIEAGAALIRYTFERLDRLNGYASGMTSPAWHQRLWTLLDDGAPTAGEPVRTHATLLALLDIADALRVRHGFPLAVPSVAAAFEQARRLADLRGRPAPLRTDLLDAVLSCYVKGDADVEGALVMGVAHSVLTGDAIGRLPPGAGTPPLVTDVLDRLRAQRLAVDAVDRRTLALDIYRRAAHRTTSRLLHGLALLDVPFALRTAGPDFAHREGLDRLQERWEYLWTPLAEGALVEASLYGATLPEAVAARFAELLSEVRGGPGGRSAETATSTLVRACQLGLHEHTGAALALARQALGADPAFDAVATATTQLGLLWEAREPLEARRLDELPDVLAEAYRRAVFLGRELHGGQCDPVAAVEALARLRELLAGDSGGALDPDLYWDMVQRLAEQHDVALVRGGATGLTYSAGRIGGAELDRAVRGHLSGTSSPTDAVGFVRGLLMTSREAAWQEPALLAGLDERLAEWEQQAFVAHLPELRLAFATMTPRETDRIASAVADLHGGRPLGTLLDRGRTAADVQGNLAFAAVVAGLLERDGLGAWGRPL